MRFNKLDLNQLVVLDALLSERSVKKAADRLFLSAPATSCALARLREFFEDPLLQQVGRTMVLTPKAESLFGPVRDVLLQVQAITTASPSFDPTTSTRKVTLEASDYVMNVLLGDVIQNAASEAPSMRFDLRLIGTRSHADFDNGDVDMLLVPDFFLAPGHPSAQLFDDDWSCVVWSEARTVGDSLSMDQYLAMEHVVCEWGAGRLASSDERMAQRLGHQRRRAVTAPNFTFLPQLLLGTERVTTLQTRLARRLSASAPLRLLPCPMPVPTLIIMAQWHKHHDRDPALTWLHGLMRRTVEAMGRASSVEAVKQ